MVKLEQYKPKGTKIRRKQTSLGTSTTRIRKKDSYSSKEKKYRRSFLPNKRIIKHLKVWEEENLPAKFEKSRTWRWNDEEEKGSQAVFERKKGEDQGGVWFVFSNNYFQFLNNISRISMHFFTHTYFHKCF